MFAIGDKEWPGISKLVEEIGECGQVCGKLIATSGHAKHWDGEGDLDARLVDEMGDVAAAIEFILERSLTDSSFRQRFVMRMRTKLALFHEWHTKGRQVLDGELVATPDSNEERCATCDRPRSAWCHQVGAAAYESCVFKK